MSWIHWIDLAGTFVFALSGMIAAVDHKLDLFGVMILGFVTALGGGTLRDLLIGSTPVAWMLNLQYLFIVTGAIPICFFFRKYLVQWSRSFFLFDTVGIALFTVLGIEKTLGAGLSVPIALLMGMVSAVFGGVIRDVLSNQVPLIFRKEIYALACLAGGVLYLLLRNEIGKDWATVASIIVVIGIRLCAIRYKWSVPFRPL